jgi:hypothetical protein
MPRQDNRNALHWDKYALSYRYVVLDTIIDHKRHIFLHLAQQGSAQKLNDREDLITTAIAIQGLYLHLIFFKATALFFLNVIRYAVPNKIAKERG